MCPFLFMTAWVCGIIYLGLKGINDQEYRGTMSYRGTWWGVQGKDAVAIGRSLLLAGVLFPIIAFLSLFSDLLAGIGAIVFIGTCIRIAYVAYTKKGPLYRDNGRN